MRVEQQTAVGRWTVAEDFDLGQCVGRQYQTRAGWNTVQSAEHAEQLIERGFTLSYGTDWYQVVRRVSAPAQPVRYGTQAPSLGYDAEPGNGFYGR